MGNEEIGRKCEAMVARFLSEKRGGFAHVFAGRNGGQQPCDIVSIGRDGIGILVDAKHCSRGKLTPGMVQPNQITAFSMMGADGIRCYFACVDSEMDIHMVPAEVALENIKRNKPTEIGGWGSDL